MSDAAFGAQEQGKKATIKYAVYNQTGTEFVGKTVAQVRAQFTRMWNIQPDAVAYHNKIALEEGHVIAANETIEFVRRLGEKGA